MHTKKVTDILQNYTKTVHKIDVETILMDMEPSPQASTRKPNRRNNFPQGAETQSAQRVDKRTRRSRPDKTKAGKWMTKF